MWSNLLLSGPPRVGKTTLVQKIIRKLPKGVEVAGFFTEEIKEGGRRQGFKVITTEGTEGVFAHYSFTGKERVGKYGVDIATFEKIAVSAMEEALSRERTKVLVVDEIGKMELFSKKFRETLLRALESPKVVMAAVGIQRDAFTEAVRRRPDAKIFEVTKGNRDDLPETILKVLSVSKF